MTSHHIAAAVLAAALAVGAHGQQTNVDQRLEQLEEEIRVLKRQRELEREQAEQKAKETPVITAGKEGFGLKSADGNFQLRLRGYIQADARFFLDDDAGTAGDTFLLRRVRPVFEGTVFRDFEFKLMPDFAGGQTVLYDAYVGWKHWPWLRVTAGKYKPPIGLERLQSARDIEFVERALPTALVPSRNVGLWLSGDLLDGVATYAAGVYNGVPDGTVGDLAIGSDKEFDGRIFLRPFKQTGIEPLRGLGFGIAGSIGDQFGSTNAPALPSFKSPGQQTFFSYRSATVFASGRHTRLAPQAYWYWGPVGLLGEYVVSAQDVQAGTDTRRISNDAWQVAGYWVLTGEKAGFPGVTPRRPFDLKTGGWGALELVARWTELDVDDDAFPVFADPAKAASAAKGWAVGLNWYLTDNVKFMLNYGQTSFDGSANRPEEKMFFSRLQLAF